MMGGTRTTDANGDLGLQLFLWGFFSNFLSAAKTPTTAERKATGRATRLFAYRLWEASGFFETQRHRPTALRGD